MFVQHMSRSLRPQGTVATVMPHGVLFRGGDEREIRTGLHRGRPARGGHRPGAEPLLRHRHPRLHPGAAREGRQAGRAPRQGAVHQRRREFTAGRAQNYLLPEHVEKIVSAYHAFADIPGFAAVVTHDELRANDVNLNIRRYADNAPPPEPQDVRAHLVGGIPKREVADKSAIFAAHGFDPTQVFVERDADYYDFVDTIASKATLHTFVDRRSRCWHSGGRVSRRL